MEQDGRKSLPHQPPLGIDPSRDIFFLTICAQPRTAAPLLETAPRLLEAIRFYHDQKKWWIHAAIIMPDHVHLLAMFPPDSEFVSIVKNWKHWTARHLGVAWQRDFFDHRLRRDESLSEKSDYLLQNAVRAGLVEDWTHWPHIWIPESKPIR